MSQANIAEYLPFDPGLARALVRANGSNWTQITQCMMDQTLENLGLPLAITRAFTDARTIAQFLDAQAELSHQTFQAALDRSRQLSELSLNLSQEVAGCMRQAAAQAADRTAQQSAAVA